MGSSLMLSLVGYREFTGSDEESRLLREAEPSGQNDFRGRVGYVRLPAVLAISEDPRHFPRILARMPFGAPGTTSPTGATSFLSNNGPRLQRLSLPAIKKLMSQRYASGACQATSKGLDSG